MKKIFMTALFMGLLLAAEIKWMPSVCQAEIIEGRAVIENGDIHRARSKAKEDAMRAYVEQQVGVHVTSATVTNMNMVVSDYINARSEGYVQVKRWVKEWQQDGLYCVKVDLEASANLIETAAGDIKKKIEQIDEDSSRGGIVVAISGFDETGAVDNDLVALNNQVTQKLKAEAGFKSVVSEAARRYLDRNPRMNSYSAQADIRKIASEARFNNGDGMEATAILRGVLNTHQVIRKGDGFVATVEASFEMVGLNSDLNDVFSDYITVVGTSRIDAIRKAQKEITSRAVKELAEQSLKTLQRESRGGVKHQKLVINVSGITDRANQMMLVVNTIKETGSSVGRTMFDASGVLHIAVDTALSNLELQMALIAIGLDPGDGDTNYSF